MPRATVGLPLYANAANGSEMTTENELLRKRVAALEAENEQLKARLQQEPGEESPLATASSSARTPATTIPSLATCSTTPDSTPDTDGTEDTAAALVRNPFASPSGTPAPAATPISVDVNELGVPILIELALPHARLELLLSLLVLSKACRELTKSHVDGRLGALAYKDYHGSFVDYHGDQGHTLSMQNSLLWCAESRVQRPLLTVAKRALIAAQPWWARGLPTKWPLHYLGGTVKLANSLNVSGSGADNIARKIYSALEPGASRDSRVLQAFAASGVTLADVRRAIKGCMRWQASPPRFVPKEHFVSLSTSTVGRNLCLIASGARPKLKRGREDEGSSHADGAKAQRSIGAFFHRG